MSHRPFCPDEYDARREGERAFERGASRYQNPYDDPWRGCEDAESAWRRGYNSAEERHQEEQAAERAAERRRQEMAEYQRAEEEAYYRQLEEQVYYAQMEQEQQPPEPKPQQESKLAPPDAKEPR